VKLDPGDVRVIDIQGVIGSTGPPWGERVGERAEQHGAAQNHGNRDHVIGQILFHTE
jgi:hypothetical protein